MANLFDSTNYPAGVPDRLVAGDRWVWKRTDLGADYSPSLYALTYSLVAQDSGAASDVEITASEDGADYLVEVASATTAAYTAGTYRWQAYITRSSDSERLTLDSGYTTVVVDMAESTADPRSHARIMVDNLQSALQSSSNTDVVAYSIGNRSITRSREEVRRELLYWEQRVAQEEADEARRQGRKAAGRMVRTRLA